MKKKISTPGLKLFSGQRKCVSTWYILKSVVHWRHRQPHTKKEGEAASKLSGHLLKNTESP